jgi:hypothetical protein
MEASKGSRRYGRAKGRYERPALIESSTRFGNATTADAVGDLRIAGNRRDGRTNEEEA